MSRRRKVLWLLAALCVLFAAYRLVEYVLDVRSAVSLENVSSIGDGMSEGEWNACSAGPGITATR
jgi:hypothetical protein